MARPDMPSTRPLLVFLGLIATSGIAATADVRLRVQVPMIAQAAGPQSITLKPGERRLVPVKVAANCPWKLSAISGNPAISVATTNLSGAPGGYSTPGNAVEVVVECAASAEGEQTGNLLYHVERR